MTSPSMLLSLDRPSPAAAAAATLLVLEEEEAAGDEEVVAVVGPVPAPLVSVNVNELSVVVVLLAGASMRVTVKFAASVDCAEVLGRDQVVVVEEVQSAVSWVAWATWSGLGFVSCAWARVVAPRAARMWEGRIGYWWWWWMGG